MDIPYVDLQVRLDVCRMRAEGAPERFDGKVDIDVSLEVPVSLEEFTAVGAFITMDSWFLQMRGVSCIHLDEESYPQLE